MTKKLIRSADLNFPSKTFWWFWEEDGEIVAEPVNTSKPFTRASSAVDCGNYGYTHGGGSFRAAVDKCHEMKRELQTA